ncbi:MAG: methyltransferase [Hyphomicrobiales bacterium]|nr:methyltransferase [Hyphomicrobiales bacterium]MDE2114307.1 methyltransferase [Hyphomicrobiales bacterium]
MNENPGVDFSDDLWLGGRLTLRQPRHGQRSGTDAVLLAASLAAPAGTGLDIGAGVGAAGLSLAMRARETGVSGCHITLVEISAPIATLAQHNITANGLSAYASVCNVDILDKPARRAAGLGNQSADFIVTNPPFYAPGTVRASPNAEKSRAHVLHPSGTAGWVRACLDLLGPHGVLSLIHIPEALPALLGAMAGHLGAITIIPVHARPGQNAIRLLVQGRKGSRAPLQVASPLVLHDTCGAFTPQAEALHRGEAFIGL